MTTELSPLNYVEQERLDALERFTVALALTDLLKDASPSISLRCQSIIAKLGLSSDMEDVAQIAASIIRLREHANVQFITANYEVPFR